MIIIIAFILADSTILPFKFYCSDKKKTVSLSGHHRIWTECVPSTTFYWKKKTTAQKNATYLFVGLDGLELFLSMSMGDDVAFRYETRRTNRSLSFSTSKKIHIRIKSWAGKPQEHGSLIAAPLELFIRRTEKKKLSRNYNNQLTFFNLANRVSQQLSFSNKSAS